MFDIAHIHPMLVHFPLALLPVALGAQMLALTKGQRLFEHQCLPSTGVALIVLAAIFGDIALDKAVDAGVKMSSLESHEEAGQLSAILLTLLAGAEVWLYRQSNASAALNWGLFVIGLGILVVLLSTAWFGGQLVYELGVNVSKVPALK